jgi:hypothetical protein
MNNTDKEEENALFFQFLQNNPGALQLYQFVQETAEKTEQSQSQSETRCSRGGRTSYRRSTTLPAPTKSPVKTITKSPKKSHSTANIFGKSPGRILNIGSKSPKRRSSALTLGTPSRKSFGKDLNEFTAKTLPLSQDPISQDLVNFPVESKHSSDDKLCFSHGTSSSRVMPLTLPTGERSFYESKSKSARESTRKFTDIEPTAKEMKKRKSKKEVLPQVEKKKRREVEGLDPGPPAPDFIPLPPSLEALGLDMQLDPHNLFLKLVNAVSGIDITAKTWHLRTYKYSFFCNNVVDWMIKRGLSTTRQSALELGLDLQKAGFIEGTSKGVVFKDDKILFQLSHKGRLILREQDSMYFNKIFHPATGVQIKDRLHLRKFNSCFTGEEFVDWLVENNHVSSRERAVRIGREFIDSKLMEHVTLEHHFKDTPLFYHLTKEGVHLRTQLSKNNRSDKEDYPSAFSENSCRTPRTDTQEDSKTIVNSDDDEIKIREDEKLTEEKKLKEEVMAHEETLKHKEAKLKSKEDVKLQDTKKEELRIKEGEVLLKVKEEAKLQSAKLKEEVKAYEETLKQKEDVKSREDTLKPKEQSCKKERTESLSHSTGSIQAITKTIEPPVQAITKTIEPPVQVITKTIEPSVQVITKTIEPPPEQKRPEKPFKSTSQPNMDSRIESIQALLSKSQTKLPVSKPTERAPSSRLLVSAHRAKGPANRSLPSRYQNRIDNINTAKVDNDIKEKVEVEEQGQTDRKVISKNEDVKSSLSFNRKILQDENFRIYLVRNRKFKELDIIHFIVEILSVKKDDTKSYKCREIYKTYMSESSSKQIAFPKHIISQVQSSIESHNLSIDVLNEGLNWAIEQITVLEKEYNSTNQALTTKPETTRTKLSALKSLTTEDIQNTSKDTTVILKSKKLDTGNLPVSTSSSTVNVQLKSDKVLPQVTDLQSKGLLNTRNEVFCTPLWVKVTEKDPRNNLMVRVWKQYYFRLSVDGSKLLCSLTPNGDEVKDLSIDLNMITSGKEVLESKQLSEPENGKYAWSILSLKLVCACKTAPERVSWISSLQSAAEQFQSKKQIPQKVETLSAQTKPTEKVQISAGEKSKPSLEDLLPLVSRAADEKSRDQSVTPRTASLSTSKPVPQSTTSMPVTQSTTPRHAPQSTICSTPKPKPIAQPQDILPLSKIPVTEQNVVEEKQFPEQPLKFSPSTSLPSCQDPFSIILRRFNKRGGVRIVLPSSMEELLSIASEKLKISGIRIREIETEAEITELSLLKHDTPVWVMTAEEEEEFV